MPSPSASKARLAWPDIAKGLSILGVVVLHVSLSVPGGIETLAAQANHLLDPLRMPLFFLVSGFFSAKVFRLSFADLFLKRLWFFLVPYVVWVPIELFWKFREYHLFDGSPMPGPGKYIEHLVEGRTMYWFLFALVVFNLILWSTRRLHPAWVIAVSLLPLTILPLHTDHLIVGRIILYLPAFLIGAYLRDRIAKFAAEGASIRNLLWSCSLYVAAFVVSFIFTYRASREVELPWPLFGDDIINYSDIRVVVNSLVQIAMLPMAIIVAVLLSKIRLVAEALMFLGRHTLVIYLGHPIALTVLYQYNVRGSDLQIGADPANPWEATWLWMCIGLVIAAIGSFAMWLISKVPYLGWTIMPPSLVRSAPTPPRVPAPTPVPVPSAAGETTSRE